MEQCMKNLAICFSFLALAVTCFSQKSEEPSSVYSFFAILAGPEQSLSGAFRPFFQRGVMWGSPRSLLSDSDMQRIESLKNDKQLRIGISKKSTMLVRSKPFVAEETIQETWPRSDGTRMSRTYASTLIYRDSAARTRIDWPVCNPVPRALNTTPGSFSDGLDAMGSFPDSAVITGITDPVAGNFYYLDNLKKAAYRFSLPPSLSDLPTSIPQSQMQYESLGVKTIGGIKVQGIRYSTKISNTADTAISESWVSSELMIGLLRKSSSSQSNGEIIQTLKIISQTEPNASLFKIPFEYIQAEGKEPEYIILH